MILTLTANPSFDRTIALSGPLDRGGVVRADAILEQAGGKGVNISRAAARAGVDTLAVFPASADSPFTTELDQHGIPCRPVAPTGPVRVNLTLTEPDGTTTKINSAGAVADRDLLERLHTTVTSAAADAAWVVLAGSLPPGAPDGWYAELAADLVGSGARVAVDTSDRPLAALAARLTTARPDVLKPNAEELALLTGQPASSLEGAPDVVAASAARLVRGGAAAVLATLGGDGAVLTTAEGAWAATAPRVTVVSTVGAGDSSLFGYLLGDLRGQQPADCLRLAVAYGSAAAALPGTTIPAPQQVHPEQVTVRTLPAPAAGQPGATTERTEATP